VIFARAQRTARATACALALVVFASPLVATLHETLVRHVACPEHGELVEDPGLQAPHPHRRASGALPALFAERDPTAPRPTEEEHQHCAVILQARVRGQPQASRTLVARASEAAATAPRHREPPKLHGLAVYLIAPKASPPLA